jgi:membrane protein implicated in regulation of membrane protease activity
LVLETIVPGILMLWFGLAAVIVGVVTLLLGPTATTQILLFIGAAIATVFLLRPVFSRRQSQAPQTELNVRGSEFIGRTVNVVEPIVHGRGKVAAGDTIWLADGDDVPAGTEVEVTGVNGTALVVRKIDQD